MVNVCAALVSTPPFAVPPLSCSCTVTVAVPLAFGRRRVGQRAVRPRRPAAPRTARRCRCVTMKSSSLAGLVGRSGADAGRPAGHGLRAGVFVHGLVGALA